MNFTIHSGDCREVLATMDAGSAQTCITSPPYWGLRDYGHDEQLGLEETPEQYVAGIVEVFHEVKRVLRDDGTLWLNIGDSYAGGWSGGARDPERWPKQARNGRVVTGATRGHGVKPKDLVGIPWMVAFALRADGWYLRSDVIWSKPNPMPESVADRPTKSHEYLFLLTKSHRYHYDADAIREPAIFAGPNGAQRSPYGQGFTRRSQQAAEKNHTIRPGIDTKGGNQGNGSLPFDGLTRNKRSVWTVATRPFPGAHFATFPPELIEPCVLAGSKPRDVVLDPFSGAGTTGMVALRHDRDYVGIELNPEYAEMSRRRIFDDAPLLNKEAA